MGLKITELKYKRYKKNIFDNLDFEVNSQEVLGVNFTNRTAANFFLKLLLGKKKVTRGKIILNNNNITALLPKERKITTISSGVLKLGFLPTKLRMAYHILKSPKFLYEAGVEYYTNKYNYKELQMIGDDLYLEELVKITENIIKEYYLNSIKIKKDWMSRYLKEISLFHQKEITALIKQDSSTILSQTLHTYIQKKEEIRVKEGYLAFLQALWDKIAYVGDLDYLCDCKFIAKKRKIKNKSFDFAEAKLVAMKYLKILGAEIAYERYRLMNARKAYRRYRINVLNALGKEKNKLGVVKNILNNSNVSSLKWIQLANDQWFEYNQKQEQLITNLLPDEASLIKGKVLEYFHKYHIALLNRTLVPRTHDNSAEIKLAQEKVITVYNQAFNQVKNLMDHLEIKMNWFRLTKNLSNFDHIKIKIINAILTKKELFIFNNTFDNLTQKEVQELNDIMTKLKEDYPLTSFLIISKNIENIKNYVNQFLFFDLENKAKVITQTEALTKPGTLTLFKTIYNNFDNIYEVNFDEQKKGLLWNGFTIGEGQNLALTEDSYQMAINPKFITLEKTKNFNKSDNLKIKGQLKGLKKIFKTNLCTFETETGNIIKFMIEDKNINLKKVNAIFLEKGALLLYDLNNNLVKVF
ncbi:hypothetical protein SSYRP_v1c00310 [Spiroplasma syrphidicola EA-1]|uniref:Uncharacterized protein n=1 Tax=Spiroplasma syrphidicola EA-1 TaxID=1276229 RepID=R4U2Q3_9MOLU|nr:hypothetical protein [Spiroplasma syrphidicola]AGM25627.1 hypothetical protein SSYRP_v1c00310 [Spiroplasma syrphidicola EA-1]